MATRGSNHSTGAARWLVAAAITVGGAYLSAAGCSDEETTGSVCVPGTTIACLGTGQCSGIQTCNADGTGYGACDCGTPTTSTSTTTTGSGGDGGAAGAGGSAGEGGSAGGAGGTGGGGTGGAGTASCTAEPGDDECVACLKLQCCPAYGPCFGSTDCACYVSCQNTTPGTCLFDCALTAVPEGAVPLVQCTHQFCAVACSPG